jgi:hypothetical protein
MSFGRLLSAGALVLAIVVQALAVDQDFLVDPGRLSLRTTPHGTKIKFRARKGSVAFPGGEAPTLTGASFQIFNTSGGTDDLCLFLPASHWRVAGIDPSYGPVAWTYSDPSNALGPVRRAHFGGTGNYGQLSVLLKGANYTLDEASQGSIGVGVRMSNLYPPPLPDHTRYCTDFAPPYATVSLDVPGAFRAQFNSPNQFSGPCPTAPTFCSPGGAFLDAR